jgi:hypothetical protein
MRVDRTTLEARHGASLQQASRLFLRHDIDGMRVAAISHVADLLDAAFAGYFPTLYISKTSLTEAAYRQAQHTGIPRAVSANDDHSKATSDAAATMIVHAADS